MRFEFLRHDTKHYMPCRSQICDVTDADVCVISVESSSSITFFTLAVSSSDLFTMIQTAAMYVQRTTRPASIRSSNHVELEPCGREKSDNVKTILTFTPTYGWIHCKLTISYWHDSLNAWTSHLRNGHQHVHDWFPLSVYIYIYIYVICISLV